MGMVRNFDGYKVVQQTLKCCPALLDITSVASVNQAALLAKSADTMEATSVIDSVRDSGPIILRSCSALGKYYNKLVCFDA